MPDKPKFEEHELYGGEVVIHFYPDSHFYYLVKDGVPLPKKKRLGGATSVTGFLGGKQKQDSLIKWAIGEYTKKMYDLLPLNEDGMTFLNTDIIKCLEQSETAWSEKRDTAATIGDYIHTFAEEYMTDLNKDGAYQRTIGKLGEPLEDDLPKIQTGIDALIKWLEDENIEIIKAEKIIYSRKYGYTGRFDAIAIKDGKHYLIDYKTGSGIYNEHYYQTSAYLKAFEEENPDYKLEGVIIVNIIKEDKEDKDGIVIKNAGDIIAEYRSRSDLVKDYKVFKALMDIKKRESELQKEYYAKK